MAAPPGPVSTPSIGRVRAWLDHPEHPDWERPRPTPRQLRADVKIAVLITALVALNVVGTLSLSDRTGQSLNAWDVLCGLALGLGLTQRRRAPIPSMLLITAVFILAGSLGQIVGYTLGFQAGYFVSIHSAVAWARNRAALWLSMAGVLLSMILWLLMSVTQFQSQAALLSDAAAPDAGPLDPTQAYLLLVTVLNLCFFGGAVLSGRAAWRSALQHELLRQQAETIRWQERRLRDQAVSEERLRLARELHDSLGHHFTGVGLLAGGARRMIERAEDPEGLRLEPEGTRRMRESVGQIEAASRSGIEELRAVLRVLRTPEDAVDEPTGAGPGLAEIPELIEGMREFGVQVRHEITAEPGEWERLTGSLPLSLQLACYRVIQESLTNIRRHSGARRALVALRVLREPRFFEIEITDDGALAPAASEAASGGFGLQGIRERAVAHGGTASWGPRATGRGWAVRCRFPLPPTEETTP